MYQPAYASPGASDLRHWIAVLLRKAGTQIRRSGDRVHTLGDFACWLGNRAARPRCVYPGCRAEVQSWYPKGAYSPIDTDLCEVHQRFYSDTVERWPRYATSAHLTEAQHVAGWARWHEEQPWT